MHWTTVFDISQTHNWFDQLNLGYGLFALPLGLAILVYGVYHYYRQGQSQKALGTAVAGSFFALVIGFMIVSQVSDVNKLVDDLVKGKCHQVEGVVTKWKHWEERSKLTDYFEGFSVNGHWFQYYTSNGGHSLGFAQMDYIKDGMYVRVWYDDKKVIARLDVSSSVPR